MKRFALVVSTLALFLLTFAAPGAQSGGTAPAHTCAKAECACCVDGCACCQAGECTCKDADCKCCKDKKCETRACEKACDKGSKQ